MAGTGNIESVLSGSYTRRMISYRKKLPATGTELEQYSMEEENSTCVKGDFSISVEPPKLSRVYIAQKSDAHFMPNNSVNLIFCTPSHYNGH